MQPSELSPEDQGIFARHQTRNHDLAETHTSVAVRMHEGKAQVKKALGSSYSVSDKEIEEALWHYYYDVSKSVSYLKSTCLHKATSYWMQLTYL